MNAAIDPARAASDLAALDRLTLQLDEVFGDLISDVEFAELIDNFKRGLR